MPTSASFLWIDQDASGLPFVDLLFERKGVGLVKCGSLVHALKVIHGSAVEHRPCGILLDAAVPYGRDQAYDVLKGSEEADGMDGLISGHRLFEVLPREQSAYWQKRTIVLSIFDEARLLNAGFKRLEIGLFIRKLDLEHPPIVDKFADRIATIAHDDK